MLQRLPGFRKLTQAIVNLTGCTCVLVRNGSGAGHLRLSLDYEARRRATEIDSSNRPMYVTPYTVVITVCFTVLRLIKGNTCDSRRSQGGWATTKARSWQLRTI